MNLQARNERLLRAKKDFDAFLLQKKSLKLRGEPFSDEFVTHYLKQLRFDDDYYTLKTPSDDGMGFRQESYDRRRKMVKSMRSILAHPDVKAKVTLKLSPIWSEYRDILRSFRNVYGIDVWYPFSDMNHITEGGISLSLFFSSICCLAANVANSLCVAARQEYDLYGHEHPRIHFATHLDLADHSHLSYRPAKAEFARWSRILAFDH